MIRSIGFTVFATLMGQVLSFLTDILIAKNFGTSWKADSYFFALVIPITLADLFVHGINATFIPTYMTYQKAGKGSSFFNSIVNVSIGIIGSLVIPVVVIVFANQVNSEYPSRSRCIR